MSSRCCWCAAPTRTTSAAVLRGADIFARWDDGDLLALLPDTDRTGAAAWPTACARRPAPHVGAAHWGGDLAEDLLERAVARARRGLAQAA